MNIIEVTGDRSRFPRMLVGNSPLTDSNDGDERIVIAKFGNAFFPLMGMMKKNFYQVQMITTFIVGDMQNQSLNAKRAQ